MLGVSPISATSYVDPITTGGPYYYWVEAMDSLGHKSPDKIPSPTAVSPTVSCGGGPLGANLLPSDKDITQLNGSNIPYPNSGPQACNAQTDALPSSVTFKVGDNVTFQINLCNVSSSSPASNMSVSDNMTNLQQIPGSSDWSATYNGSPLAYDGTSNSGLSDHYYITGTAPNQTINFNLSRSADNVNANSTNVITYKAQMITPPGFSGNSSRFHNSFVVYFSSLGINYNVSRATPYIPFYINTGGADIHEIP